MSKLIVSRLSTSISPTKLTPTKHKIRTELLSTNGAFSSEIIEIGYVVVWNPLEADVTVVEALSCVAEGVGHVLFRPYWGLREVLKKKFLRA